MKTKGKKTIRKIPTDFGKRVSQGISNLKITKKKFIEDSGLDSAQFHRILNGDTANPTLDTIQKLCRNLKVSGHWLLLGEGEMLPLGKEEMELLLFVRRLLNGGQSLSEKNLEQVKCLLKGENASVQLRQNIEYEFGSPSMSPIIYEAIFEFYYLQYFEKAFKRYSSKIDEHIKSFDKKEDDSMRAKFNKMFRKNIEELEKDLNEVVCLDYRIVLGNDQKELLRFIVSKCTTSGYQIIDLYSFGELDNQQEKIYQKVLQLLEEKNKRWEKGEKSVSYL